MTVHLTADERYDHEIDGHYGRAATSISIDHKGRIFAHSTSKDGPGTERMQVVIFNEAVVGRESVERLMALCRAWLEDTDAAR